MSEDDWKSCWEWAAGMFSTFQDRTFRGFFAEYRVEVDAERYRARGASKANRMRRHWEMDANQIVGRVICGLIDYAIEERGFGDSDPVLIDGCRKIAQRVLSHGPVAEMDALAATTGEDDFEVLAGYLREAIENNKPEAALDACTHS